MFKEIKKRHLHQEWLDMIIHHTTKGLTLWSPRCAHLVGGAKWPNWFKFLGYDHMLANDCVSSWQTLFYISTVKNYLTYIFIFFSLWPALDRGHYWQAAKHSLQIFQKSWQCFLFAKIFPKYGRYFVGIFVFRAQSKPGNIYCIPLTGGQE